MLAATDAALLAALGEQQAAALAARGAALEYADAVAYLRAQAESVLQRDLAGVPITRGTAARSVPPMCR